ncbi:hypothetical protein V8C44DRAFT_322003 [Trichoderma aethiopicum]
MRCAPFRGCYNVEHVRPWCFVRRRMCPSYRNPYQYPYRHPNVQVESGKRGRRGVLVPAGCGERVSAWRRRDAPFVGPKQKRAIPSIITRMAARITTHQTSPHAAAVVSQGELSLGTRGLLCMHYPVWGTNAGDHRLWPLPQGTHTGGGEWGPASRLLSRRVLVR